MKNIPMLCDRDVETFMSNLNRQVSIQKKNIGKRQKANEILVNQELSFHGRPIPVAIMFTEKVEDLQVSVIQIDVKADCTGEDQKFVENICKVFADQVVRDNYPQK